MWFYHIFLTKKRDARSLKKNKPQKLCLFFFRDTQTYFL